MKQGLKYLLIITASALVLSAAYFSVTGFAKLFSGAFVAVLIMMSALELSKLTTTSFLYRYWGNINKALKLYLVSALIVLMCITSVGIYGFLSSAYSETTGKLDQIQSQSQLIDKKKAIINEEVSRIKQSIQEKDKRINTLSSLRSQQEQRIDTLYKKGMISGVKRTEQIISNADLEIKNLNKQNDSLNKIVALRLDSINQLDVRQLNINNNIISGEVGPLKYIARLFNTDMDKVVNILIILLIVVFDPLAMCLVIATNKVIEENKIKTLSLEPMKGVSERSFIDKWKYNSGENTLRVTYQFTSLLPVIFDIGNSEEWWVKEMLQRHKGSTIHIFEEDKSKFNQLKELYKDNNRVHPCNFIPSPSFIKLFYSKIDLLKLDLDGKEYEFLNPLFEAGVVSRVKNYQIQFHKINETSEQAYEEIIQKFYSNSYIHTYKYLFVWENLVKV